MPLFQKDTNSLFETLGRSRQDVLSRRPVIPPPGALARPGMPAKPVEAPRAPRIPQAVLERAVDDLLDVDGDPILVVDDELDVSAITPEDGVATDDPPAQMWGVRVDTAVVFGIGLCLVVAIAYFAGRTTNKNAATAAAPSAEKQPAALLKPPVQLPVEKPAPVAEKPVDAPAEDPAPPPPPPKPAAVEGNYEMWVVSTTDEKAAKVASFLNDDMMSPIYGKGLSAYVKKTSRGGQVRIKGFDKEDASVLSAIQDMRDPTGGGRFKDAIFRKISRK